jgi:hypothetical protein
MDTILFCFDCRKCQCGDDTAICRNTEDQILRRDIDMFTIRIRIKTSPVDDRYLSKCFFFGCDAKNKMVSHAVKRLNALNCDAEYRKARQEY